MERRLLEAIRVKLLTPEAARYLITAANRHLDTFRGAEDAARCRLKHELGQIEAGAEALRERHLERPARESGHPLEVEAKIDAQVAGVHEALPHAAGGVAERVVGDECHAGVKPWPSTQVRRPCQSPSKCP